MEARLDRGNKLVRMALSFYRQQLDIGAQFDTPTDGTKWKMTGGDARVNNRKEGKENWGVGGNFPAFAKEYRGKRRK